MKLIEKIILVFFVAGASIIIGLGVYGNLTASPWWDSSLNCTPDSIVVPTWLPLLLFFGLASFVGSSITALIYLNKN